MYNNSKLSKDLSYILFPLNAKYNPPNQRITWKLSYSITSKNDSGLPIHITPVIIEPIVKPLNLVIISPIIANLLSSN